METYRQPIRVHDRHVTMLGMVSDLTGLVRRYYGNWQRPLAENRADLKKAKKLGDSIVGLASQRPWRQTALENVLSALKIQDRQMHRQIIHVLTEARVARAIEAHKVLHNELRSAFDQEDMTAIWQTSSALYQLSHRTLTFLDLDSLHAAAFYGRLGEVKREDPVMHARIVFTLDEVASLRSESSKSEIPRPRNEVKVVRRVNAGRF